MRSSPFSRFPPQVDGLEADRQGRAANRRRLLVFVGTFVVTAIVGLVYVYSRPALYQSSARLDFVPAGAGPGDPARAAATPFALRDEVQYLTSRPLLERVWADLGRSANTPAALQAGDPPATLQSMLEATPVDGTNVVVLRAVGTEAAFLPRFLERVVADYRSGLGERYRSGSTVAATEADEEVRRLEAGVAERRRDADAFRARHRIVSLERDENQVLSGVRGLGNSLNAANEKAVAAEARLAALTDAEASGRSVVRGRDPTLTALEQESARIRADLTETGRTFTPAYMDIDPRIRSLRARLADIDQQIAVQRQSSRQSAIQEAQEEVASARAAVAALRRQLAADQDATQAFTSRFNEYRAMQEEVSRLQALRQKAVERVAVLRAEQQTRAPKVEVVEAAATPQASFSPRYARDTGIAFGVALLAGLVTMAIVELFNRPARLPSTIVLPQGWGPATLVEAATALPSPTAHAALGRAEAPLTLPAPATLPRELQEAEIDALLASADPSLRPAIALMLMGLTAGEVVALRRGDVDRDGGAIVVGTAGRRVALPPRVMGWLPVVAEAADAADAALLDGPAGRPPTEGDLATSLLYAAHDAAIDDADAVTPEALRHTCIAHLVRQGMRFSDIARQVGTLPPDRLAEYRRMAPALASNDGTAAAPLPGVSRPPA